MTLRNTVRTVLTSAVLMSAVAVGAAAPAGAGVSPAPVATTADSGSASGSASAMQSLLDAITCPFVKLHC
ncbi:hypothetical protein LTV02_30920 [Nocardia yamanashiensis]|uniref:hypothetical protein n=1 Tax=Nocardia yamanashiensis TaxID=209247 RepID=UPI001E65C16D|nr:hypothetical protein [Nocardia yamanashiensis]UGT40385.1 hypothetical protein LTV02_30920 [Nocardia yamanashiensis]